MSIILSVLCCSFLPLKYLNVLLLLLVGFTPRSVLLPTKKIIPPTVNTAHGVCSSRCGIVGFEVQEKQTVCRAFWVLFDGLQESLVWISAPLRGSNTELWSQEQHGRQTLIWRWCLRVRARGADSCGCVSQCFWDCVGGKTTVLNLIVRKQGLMHKFNLEYVKQFYQHLSENNELLTFYDQRQLELKSLKKWVRLCSVQGLFSNRMTQRQKVPDPHWWDKKVQ